jgi:hypothetical protein
MSLEVWRQNSHYYITMIYVVINLVHGKIGPLEKQNQAKQVTGDGFCLAMAAVLDSATDYSYLSSSVRACFELG